MHCSKKLREHLNHTSDLDEQNIQVEILHWYNSKWTVNGNPLRARFKIKVKNCNRRLIQLAWILSRQLKMWLSSVYGPHLPVRTPDNIWACSWWEGRRCPGGSPPRPGSEHQWAPGHSMALPGGGKCTETLRPRGSQLDSSFWGTWGPVNGIKAMRHPGTAYTPLATWGRALSCTRRNPGPTALSARPGKRVWGFHPGTWQQLGYRWPARGGLGDPASICLPRPWLTHCTRPLMLDDVGGSVTFTTAPPDSFTSVTRANCEPALICEKNGVTNLANLVFSGKSQSSCTVLCSWALLSLEDVRPSRHPHGVWFWQ